MIPQSDTNAQPSVPSEGRAEPRASYSDLAKALLDKASPELQKNIFDLLWYANMSESDATRAEGTPDPKAEQPAAEPLYTPIIERYDGPYEPEERDHNWRRAWGIVGMLIANDLLPMPRDVGDTDDVPGNRDERTTLDLALSVVADSLHWIEN